MIKFKSVSKMYPDGMEDYVIQLNKQYSVRSFIEEVMKRDEKEWGYIGIFDKKQSWFERGNPFIEYDRNGLKSEFSEDIMNATIKSITANGGWSRMDYKIKINKF
jgi:GDP-D-mannose dehydratase